MAEIQRTSEAAPKQEIKTDFNQMVETALADKRLNREERGEILSVIDKMNSEKETINSQTVAKLEAFLKGAQWWTDFEKTKKILLEKISANKRISESWSVSTRDSLGQGEDEVSSTAQTPPTNTPTQTPNSTTEKELWIIEKSWAFISSWMDTVKNVFSPKIDLSTLPETDKKIIEDLQTAGFTLTPIEGKSSTYELDMLGIGDKSTLTIQGEKMKFTTNRVMENGTQKEFEFTDLRDAKEKLTQINEYIKVSFEIKPLDEKYHKDFQEQDRYDALSKQKASLENTLWISASWNPSASAK